MEYAGDCQQMATRLFIRCRPSVGYGKSIAVFKFLLRVLIRRTFLLEIHTRDPINAFSTHLQIVLGWVNSTRVSAVNNTMY